MKKAINQSTAVFLLNAGSVAALLLIAIIFSFFVNQNNIIYRENINRYDLTENAKRFMDGSAYLTSEVRLYAATGDIKHYDNYWNEVNNLKNRDIGIQNMKDIGITSEENAMIEQMLALSNSLVPLEDEAMQNVQAHKTDLAMSKVFGSDYVNVISQIKELQTKFLDSLEQRTTESINVSSNKRFVLQVILFILIALVIVIQISNYLVIRKKLIKPVIVIEEQMKKIAEGNLSYEFELTPDTSEVGMLIGSIIFTKSELKKYISDISNKLSKMAEGDMSVNVDIDYLGEFVPIKESMIKIISSLNNTLSKINETSYRVASGAQQISDGSSALSQGTIEQANSINELSKSIDDIVERIKENVSYTYKANDSMNKTTEEIEKGNSQMAKMVEAMKNISSSSDEIGKIIKTIDDIAFQTNILALNAAVEAARAGEAGKGFAVVADEVRNLAGKSGEAAKNTALLIEGSIKAVSEGSHIAEETAQSLNGIVSEVKNIIDIFNHVSESSKEQETSISNITSGVHEITSVINANSATAEKSAAESEELSSQAQLLKSLVNNFKLKK